MRDGAGTNGHRGRRASRSRIRVHAEEILGGCGAFLTCAGAFHVWRGTWAAHRAQRKKWNRTIADVAGGAVGRLAVFRALLEFASEPQPKHVHADRAGGGRGVFLQRGSDALSAIISGIVSRDGWRSFRVFRS